MIKKIICPTDFSPASQNAVNYAANMCQVLGTSLELITIETVYLTSMMIPPVYIQEKTLTTVEMMEYICDHIKNSFHIPCEFEIFISNHSIAKTLEQNKNGEYLIVMGTSAQQSLMKRWIGSRTYRFIKRTNSPLLMIPEHISYQGIKKIVFAAKENLNLHAYPLEFIQEKYKPELTILRVYPAYTYQKETKKIAPEKNGTEKIFSSNTFDSIHAYMLYTQSELLVVMHKRRSLLRNLFHASVIKKLSHQDSYPVLILKV